VALKKLVIDPASLAVEYANEITLLPAGRVKDLRGVSYAVNPAGAAVCLLADVHGEQFPREQSDMLYLATSDTGVVSYVQMQRSALVPMHPGCRAVAAASSTSLIFCAVVEASTRKNYIVRISDSNDSPTAAYFAGAPAGYSTGSIDGIGTNMKLNGVSSMVVSPDASTLYVAEQGAHKIRQIDIATAESRTICGSLSSVFGNNDGVGTQASLHAPAAIALTPDGSTLIIAEAGGNRVRALDLASLTTSTLAGDLGGAAGLQDGEGSIARFATPTGVAVAPGGKSILIADSVNNCVRRLVL